MNIFVSGIHGVGKTFLASRLSPDIGLMHISASTLIREERALPEWSAQKNVSNIDENQIALASAIRRYNAKGTALLLDGHFVLLDHLGNFVPLNVSVFSPLNIGAVLLIEERSSVIAERITARDSLKREENWLESFMQKEKEQAQSVCASLKIPLEVLSSATESQFVDALKKVMKTSGY